MTWSLGKPKMQVYGELVRSLMSDFVRSIRTSSEPRVSLADAVEAVRIAEQATRLADS